MPSSIKKISECMVVLNYVKLNIDLEQKIIDNLCLSKPNTCNNYYTLLKTNDLLIGSDKLIPHFQVKTCLHRQFLSCNSTQFLLC